MKAKEKAEELREKMFCSAFATDMNEASKQALIVVEEILNLPIFWVDKELQKEEPEENPIESTEEFWIEVKNKLNKML